MKSKAVLVAALAASGVTSGVVPSLCGAIPGLHGIKLAQAQQAQKARVVEDPSDVMGGAMPKFPVFPRIAKKPGHIRGWVKDATGKPLKGARIEIGSTAIGGAKTYVSARSDEKGLYEVVLPRGACNITGAGYVITLGGMRANLPLHAVDGEIDTFASAKGDTENFVLLPYGVASPGGASENPSYEFYYYGGSIRIVYWTRSDDNPLPVGSTIEILLQPRGALIDGSKGSAFLVRQPVEDNDPGTININNIPAGLYDISARLINDGKATKLRMEDKATKRRDGLKPKVTSGTATLMFSPKSGQDGPRTLNYTGWEPILIEVKPED